MEEGRLLIRTDRLDLHAVLPEEYALLAVDRAEDAFTLRHLQRAERRVAADRIKLQRFIARDDDGAGNRRQIACLATLLVVLHELVDLASDDLTLVGLLARGDPSLEQIPVDL